jgi:predicted HicB family RNase H-like nuclease
MGDKMKKIERLGMRVNPEDKKRWEKAAIANGLSLSAWIEKVLNAQAIKQERAERHTP